MSDLRMKNLMKNFYSTLPCLLSLLGFERVDDLGAYGILGAALAVPGKSFLVCQHRPTPHSQYVHPKHPPDKEYGDDGPRDVNYPIANCFGFPKIKHAVMVAGPARHG
jgi:hypothetical protein